MFMLIDCRLMLKILCIIKCLSLRCYDKDDYPTSTQDEFIVPVALGTGLGASPSVGTTFRTSPPTHSGQKPLEINPQTLEIARLVVAEYNRREDDDEYYKFVKLHEASSQVSLLTIIHFPFYVTMFLLFQTEMLLYSLNWLHFSECGRNYVSCGSWVGWDQLPQAGPDARQWRTLYH